MNNELSSQLVVTEQALKRHTKRLQQEMLQFKQDFKLSDAQNMLAKVFGTKDFHELNSLIKERTIGSPTESQKIENVQNEVKVNTVPLPEYSQKDIDYLAKFKPTWENQFNNNLTDINKTYLDMLSDILYHFSYLYSSVNSSLQAIENKRKTWDLLQYAIKNQDYINFDLFNKEGYNLLELILTCEINTPFIYTLINKTCVDKHLHVNKNVLYISYCKPNTSYYSKISSTILKKIKTETLLEKRLYKGIINLMYFRNKKLSVINDFLEKIDLKDINYNDIINNEIIIDRLVSYSSSKKYKDRYENVFEFLNFLSQHNYSLHKDVSSSFMKSIKRYEEDIERCLSHFNNQSKARQNYFKKSLVDLKNGVKVVIDSVSAIYTFEINKELSEYINM